MVRIFSVIIASCGLIQALVANEWTKVENSLDVASLRDNIFMRKSTAGQAPEFGQFPYHAMLELKNNKGSLYVCGGSIIAFSWILTAAHCLNGKISADVYVGIVNLSPMSYVWGLKVNKDSFIAHERYDVSTSTNNIGLVYLTSEIPKNDHIILISLPTRAEAYENLDEKTGTIIGFGKNSDEANSISTLLRWVEVSIIRNDECYSLLGTKISESNFCAEITSGRKACYGDNGGPLTILRFDGTPELAGIVSLGSIDECADPLILFTRVHSFLHWIQSNTGVQIS